MKKTDWILATLLTAAGALLMAGNVNGLDEESLAHPTESRS
ncbi:hypothetical protein Aab01nite_76770 [Paractinoplanes abujensis]|uniref:Uncharacterized protein n=1 Tax=Paractinoplanes abujensis TaxID=882441 RepID=A0A7W7CSA7_9ACTN|nr:hypothetical protein [Actinoplanes abujensis]MBB4692435.1 hypothetical protein [Actinoplanes abujensis]GID24087.1 hypothetical protein Aab01nite_76770 [Actinoplanes abujensis]